MELIKVNKTITELQKKVNDLEIMLGRKGRNPSEMLEETKRTSRDSAKFLPEISDK